MSRHKDWLAAVFLVFVVLAVFWQATRGGIFYFGDIYQLHYPLRSAYAEELPRLSLPLWTPHVLAGYPLLAEGQLGALYPPNVFLHLILPVPIALNVFILGHFVLAATGAYAFARRLAMHRSAALCSGIVFALGGFLVAHLNHVNIVAAAAWLPWLFLLTDRILASDVAPARASDSVLLAVGFALEFLSGHAQIALLSLLSVLLYTLYLAWAAKPRHSALVVVLVAVLLGAALAAPQLLPSYELTQLSVRSGGLDPAYFTTFSLHPLYMASLLAPFVLGNPYPKASVELVGYIGWLPLLLALLAPFLTRWRPEATARPVRHARFFAILSALALLLSLGRWNPLYMLLLRLPGFNLFRVPARYLYLFAFSAAMLAGLGFDTLLARLRRLTHVADERGWLAVAVVAACAVYAAARPPSVDRLLALWVWLPPVLACLALVWLIWAWRSRSGFGALPAVGLALVLIDLIAFNAVYNRTYNQTIPLDEFTAPPRSLSFFRSQPGVYRLQTHEEIVPVLPVMRESYYPNLSLVHGLSASNGLFPLTPTRYGQYVENMTPRMLDLLGVKYFLIPQVLPVDEASEFYDLEDPFALNPVGKRLTIPLTRVAAVELESYLSHSVDWPDGHAVAEIRLHGAEGRQEVVTLRAGWHTAEWAYNRSDVTLMVRHRQPPVARAWPARSGFPPEDHTGYVYRARFVMPVPFPVLEIEVQPLVPSAYLRVERLFLEDEGGERQLLSDLLNTGDHTLAYRSEDVAVYLNHDALPRAFAVHTARVVPEDAETLRLLSDPSFDPRSEVLLSAGQPTEGEITQEALGSVDIVVYDARRVVVKAHMAADGYLVLADAWYPGWQARVDGEETPLLRADLIFRAVPLTDGDHTVEFVYAPLSFRFGLWISAAALICLGVLWLHTRRAAAGLY